MSYTIVERNIGRAGTKAAMEKKKQALDLKYGEGNWLTGYEIEGQFLTREQAIERIYDPSYFDFLDKNPKWVQELVQSGGVYNPHALFSNSVDIQAATVERYMVARNLRYEGTKLLPIGSYQPKYNQERVFAMAREKGLTVTDKIIYPPIAYALNPFSIPCIVRPEMSIEDFWQCDAKVLAVKSNEAAKPASKPSGYQTKVCRPLDIFEDGDVICVTTNAEIRKDGRAVMGRGVAEEVRDTFQDIDLKLAQLLKEHGNRVFKLGTYLYHGKKVHIVSFPTKEKWGENSKLDLIKKSAGELLELVNKYQFKKVYLPMPGGGKGGLNWSDISKELKNLDDRFIVTSLSNKDFQR